MKINLHSSIIHSQLTYRILLYSNIFLSCIIFYAFRNLQIGDETSYLSYAEGLKHGRFSHWWFLSEYFPDTFRTPGYPVFLYLLKKISTNIYFIKYFQFLLYLLSILMIIKVAERYDSGYRLKNIFLLLLLPYIHVAVFSPTIMPETLMTFLITLYIYIDSKPISGELKYSLLGLLSGVIFLVRPVFLFFPLIHVAINLITRRKNFTMRMGFSMLLIYFLTILPYGLWNYKNHHVLSLTPIEGAAGVFNLGYWSFKLPGYYEDRCWSNRMSNEIISFTDFTDTSVNIKAFNQEWDFIDSSCAKYLTTYDSLTISVMNMFPHFFKTYNTEYTLYREKLIQKVTFDDIKKDFYFTVKVKLFTIMRSWVTGIQRNDLQDKRFIIWAGALYFSIVSCIIFFASIILVPYAFYKRKLLWENSMTAIVLIVYYGIIHLPFAIQARYTIPLRLVLLLILARSISGLFSKKNKIIG